MFTGFSVAALDFYDDLEMDNTKSFWEAHRHDVRHRSRRADEGADGRAVRPSSARPRSSAPTATSASRRTRRPTRPPRVRSSPPGPSTGWYVQVGAPGVMVGAGFYDASPARLASVREAIVHDRHGPELEGILRDRCSQPVGTSVATPSRPSPRGYDADHPRIELLRHKSMTLSKQLRFRAVHPHPRATRPGAHRLARAATVDRLAARRARQGLDSHQLRAPGLYTKCDLRH